MVFIIFRVLGSNFLSTNSMKPLQDYIALINPGDSDGSEITNNSDMIII